LSIDKKVYEIYKLHMLMNSMEHIYVHSDYYEYRYIVIKY
jgi:hypothetical protein